MIGVDAKSPRIFRIWRYVEINDRHIGSICHIKIDFCWVNVPVRREEGGEEESEEEKEDTPNEEGDSDKERGFMRVEQTRPAHISIFHREIVTLPHSETVQLKGSDRQKEKEREHPREDVPQIREIRKVIRHHKKGEGEYRECDIQKEKKSVRDPPTGMVVEREREKSVGEERERESHYENNKANKEGLCIHGPLLGRERGGEDETHETEGGESEGDGSVGQHVGEGKQEKNTRKRWGEIWIQKTGSIII